MAGLERHALGPVCPGGAISYPLPPADVAFAVLRNDLEGRLAARRGTAAVVHWTDGSRNCGHGLRMSDGCHCSDRRPVVLRHGELREEARRSLAVVRSSPHLSAWAISAHRCENDVSHAPEPRVTHSMPQIHRAARARFPLAILTYESHLAGCDRAR